LIALRARAEHHGLRLPPDDSAHYAPAVYRPPLARKSSMMSLKNVVKQVLDRYPFPLKGNRVFHEIERYRAYRHVRLRPELTPRPDLLETLDRDGIVVLPEYFPRHVAGEWLAQVDDVVARMREGKLSKFLFPVHGLDFCRMAWADTLVPGSRQFFEDPLVTSLARAYLSPRVTSYRHEVDFKGGPAPFGLAELYHFDNWRPTVKAFLYLTDVNERTAPFVYAKGTHKLAPWRTRYDIEFDIHNKMGRYGHFFPQEVERLRKETRFEDKVCTGPAGTLILADFRGLHRATPVQEGRRVLLNNCFGLMDEPVGPAPPLSS
jgi:hypothetical protein